MQFSTTVKKSSENAKMSQILTVVASPQTPLESTKLSGPLQLVGKRTRPPPHRTTAR